MNRNLLVIFLVIFCSLFGGAAITPAQDICPTIEVCQERLVKTLTDLDAKDAQLANKDKEIKNRDDQILEYKAMRLELLAVIKEFAEADTKAKKKGWWARTKQILDRVIDTATDPETIRLIGTILILKQAAGK